MLQILIEFKLIIIICLLLIGLLIFRKEFNKFLDWMVGFRKIAGTKAGYKILAETEPPGSPSESNAKEEERELAEKDVEVLEDEKPVKEKSWISFYVKKDYGKALELLEENLSSEQDEEKRKKIKAFIGAVKFEIDSKEGEKYFEKTLEESQGSSEDIYHWYTLIYYWKDRYDEALNIIERGIESNPSSALLYDLFADCLVKQSREIEAVEMLFERLKQAPEIAENYRKIAVILSEMGKNELARDSCRLGFKYCPNDTALLEEYGRIVSEMNDFKEAMFIYFRLTMRKPEEAKFWTLLGNQYLQLYFNDLALEAYKKGNECAKESEGWIIANIGNLMRNRGFYTEAATYLKRGISLEPESVYAHKRLAEALEDAKAEVEKRDTIRNEVLEVVRGYRSPEDIINEAKNESSQQGDSVEN